MELTTRSNKRSTSSASLSTRQTGRGGPAISTRAPPDRRILSPLSDDGRPLPVTPLHRPNDTILDGRRVPTRMDASHADFQRLEENNNGMHGRQNHGHGGGGGSLHVSAGASAGGGGGGGGSGRGPANPLMDEEVRVATVMEANDEYCNNQIITSKYTWYTFLPRSLFEQFRRTANVYFLVISMLMLIGTYERQIFDSPLTPFTTLGPLVIVLAITMAKEGVEDCKRHSSDKEVNNRVAHVLQPDSSFQDTRWVDIRVGQVIRVDSRGEMPADLVLLQTSEAGAMCYIETSNIDGETNLKVKEAVTQVASAHADTGAVAGIKGKAAYELPNDSIHTFEGRLELSSIDSPVTLVPKNVVLRGCTLRNTKWVLGLVVFTGLETKVMKKASGARSKMSRLERNVNRCILVIYLTQVFLCTLSMALELTWSSQNDGDVGYLMLDDNLVVPDFVSVWLTFVVLFNNFIPISLYVTIEMVNFAQAFLVDKDREMYDPVSDTPAKARTSNLNQDLGQIEYVFSDKTGTLTRNIMEFKMCSIGGKSFGRLDTAEDLVEADRRISQRRSRKHKSGSGESKQARPPPGEGASFHDDQLRGVLAGRSPPSSIGVTFNDLDKFFLCMCLCHTVVPEEDEQGISVYQAESPDEGALVGAARSLGYEFVSRSPNSVTINARGKKATYELLGVHAFNADRKRMSVVLRDPEGNGIVYTKGADNVMTERASPGPHDNTLQNHLNKYASDGLRTLVLAQRRIPQEELSLWQSAFEEASASVGNRKERLAQVAEQLERNLEIVGATAIEDKLQAGVPETIHDLGRAGIKTWVLTGDKVETAINIGFSCKLLTNNMQLIHLTQHDPETLRAYLTALASTVAPTRPVRRKQRPWWKCCSRGRRGSFASRRPVSRVRTLFDESGARNRSVEVTGAASHHTEEKPIVDAQPSRYHSTDIDHSPRPAVARAVSRLPKVVVEADGSLPPPAVIVTGEALSYILGDHQLEERFLTVAQCAKSVVACRVSPPQKAALVRMVRKHVSGKPVTLAIGDGANDVGMIQQAEVGVGISGKEGLQAVNASDFAIAQFRFLKPLLLVHGRWSYRRMATVFLYSFYKNVVITLVLFYFNIYTGWSGTSLFESLVYSGYNFFLGLPIVGVGILDRDLSRETVLKHPGTYISGRENLNLHVPKMIQWIIHGVVHATIVFFVPVAATLAQGGVNWSSDGMYDGKDTLGISVFSALILAMQFKISIITKTWTWWAHFLLWLSIIGYVLFIIVYNYMLTISPSFYIVANTMFSRPTFWMMLLLVLGMCVLLDYTVESIRLQYLYTPIDVAVEIDRGVGVSKVDDDWGDGTSANAGPGAGAGAGAGGPAGVPYTPPEDSTRAPAPSMPKEYVSQENPIGSHGPGSLPRSHHGSDSPHS